MKGQWIGKYSGDVDGNVMVNVDESEDHYEAVAYVTPHAKEIPGSIVYISTPNKSDEQTAIADTRPIHPSTGFPTTWNEIKDLYGEGVSHSTEAQVSLKLNNNKLIINALSDIGVTFYANLEKTSGNGQSKIPGKKMSWAKFKKYISEMPKSGYLFRGQQEAWRLCTSFHRHGRYRISEFTNKDVKQLHRKLSAITSHFFDLSIPDQNGAFFNLLQHHGYPTPLLDWSHSPYVAAFFAFRDVQINCRRGKPVRIYIFNNQDWQNTYPQIANLDPPHPHLSVMEFIAIGNPRAVPQQAVTTVTNLNDIERYIIEKENETGIQFLEAIDIPASSRETAMRDLRFMGITAGSMFPGIDGVCEELRERNFDG